MTTGKIPSSNNVVSRRGLLRHAVASGAGLGILSVGGPVILGYGEAMAAESAQPTEIKVGILLPLTGTFAAVAQTQKQGALLAIDVVNKRGGLNMPWGKVKVEGIVDDDEA